MTALPDQPRRWDERVYREWLRRETDRINSERVRLADVPRLPKVPRG